MEQTRHLQDALTSAGYRVTRQRQVVYETLDRLGGHPTAEEIFQAARAAMPRLSLATVYKALESLEDAGLVRKLTPRGGSARFETRMEHHFHARCRSCDSVVDVDAQETAPSALAAHPLRGFRIESTTVEFLGVCVDCNGA